MESKSFFLFVAHLEGFIATWIFNPIGIHGTVFFAYMKTRRISHP